MKILIADDHGIVRRGLQQIIALRANWIVADEVSSADEVLPALRRQVFDIEMNSAVDNPLVFASAQMQREPLRPSKVPAIDDCDQIVVGHRMSLTMSCDHRVIDGALGAEYLKELRHLLENPALLMV